MPFFVNGVLKMQFKLLYIRVSKMPFCCILGSQNVIFFVWGLKYAILLYMGVLKMAFCIWGAKFLCIGGEIFLYIGVKFSHLFMYRGGHILAIWWSNWKKLLYKGVSKMPFFVDGILKIDKILFPLPILDCF